MSTLISQEIHGCRFHLAEHFFLFTHQHSRYFLPLRLLLQPAGLVLSERACGSESDRGWRARAGGRGGDRRAAAGAGGRQHRAPVGARQRPNPGNGIVAVNFLCPLSTVNFLLCAPQVPAGGLVMIWPLIFSCECRKRWFCSICVLTFCAIIAQQV
jgi:hypothetical protein